ncbi:unnamed protein product [Ectocarpus sp. 6 AP-2014]
MGAPKLLGGVALVGSTVFYVLPMSMHVAFGADIPPSTYFGMAVLIGLPIFGFIAFEMWKTLGDNRRVRKERRKLEAIEAQSFGCIRPQVLDSFVVFPVRVSKRGCAGSSWVELGEQAVAVNLCAAAKISGAVDTEGPLRRLCEATFGSELDVIVYCGGGTAGPTGLAVGVGRQNFGPYLASRVAHSIKEAMRLGIQGQ